MQHACDDRKETTRTPCYARNVHWRAELHQLDTVVAAFERVLKIFSDCALYRPCSGH